jgi:hypothetical protein
MGLKQKNKLSTSNLKEPIEFKMMISTIRENIFGGKEKKIICLNHTFELSPYRLT